MMKRAFTLYALVAILGVATYASDRTEAEMRAIAGQQLLGALSKGTGPAAMNVKLEKKYLAMMAQYGETDVDRASAKARLEALNGKK